MADKTGIEWTDATWNPTTGCDRVSSGCDHCYALTLAGRLKAMGSARYQNDGNPETSGPGFRLTTHADALDQPLRWTKPRRIFVNSMSDLFHDGVSDDFIAQVWAVMAATPQHTYQILTKRHGRMRSFLRDVCRCGAGHPSGTHLHSKMMWAAAQHSPTHVPGLTSEAVAAGSRGFTWGYGLPNVWVGVSVENQQWADIRIPALLETPAAVRFLSMEPLLGAVDLTRWIDDERGALDQAADVDWVIVGGESGAGARPMHPSWPRSLRDQCRQHGVPFHFKQWGAWGPWMSHPEGEDGPGDTFVNPDGSTGHVWFNEDLGYATNYAGAWGPDSHAVSRVGKKIAGRQLDGCTHDEFPGGLR